MNALELHHILRVGHQVPTPAYIYHEEAVSRNVVTLRDTLNGARILVSLKANANPALLTIPRSYGLGAEVTSLGELKAALAAGYGSSRIVFGGPAKLSSECQGALEAGVRIFSVETLGDLTRILSSVRGHERECKLYFRVNPRDVLKDETVGAAELMVGETSHFGMLPEELRNAYSQATANNVQVVGLHFYVGSQILDASVYRKVLPTLVQFSKHIFPHDPIASVNLGGGFGIPYREGEELLDLASLKETVAHLVNSNPGIDFFFESGRFIFASAGIFLCTIIDVILRGNVQVIVVDGSMSQFARPSFLRLEHRAFLFDPAGCAKDLDSKRTRIVGRACTPLDVYASDCLMPKACPGDKLAITEAGAYGWEMSFHHFLGRGAAREYLFQGEGSLNDISRTHSIQPSQLLGDVR